MSEDKERVAFEKWYSTTPSVLGVRNRFARDKHEPEEYYFIGTRKSFAAWMAAKSEVQPSDGALANEGAEPVALTPVAVLRDNGDGGLEPDWLLEGGAAELFEGMTLLVADDAPGLCLDGGHAELYRLLPAPASVVLPRLQMSDVVKAHMDIPRCPVLTSNQCHALAMKLNACLDRVKDLNS